jgi:hypothetical protein
MGVFFTRLVGKGLLPLLLLATSGVQAANAPDRNEYAWGFPLSVSGDKGFYTAAIPLSVYRSATDKQLRDAGVYNASGQAVPRIFEHLNAVPESTSRRESLSIIPLFLGQTDSPDALRLRLRQGAAETMLELDSHGAKNGSTQSPVLSAYFVQTQEFKQEIRSLEFDWSEVPEDFIGRVEVDGSDDLQHWRSIGRSTLARLSFDDASIEQNSIQLQGGLYNFLRITWLSMPASWKLDGVIAVFSDQPEERDRDWLELDPDSHDPQTGEWVFDVDGFPPIDRVALLLPPENVLVRATVFHRASTESQWRRSYNGIFYHLKKSGKLLESPPASIATARTGQWKIRLDSGFVSGPVRLRLGWVPDRMSFVAQGQGPWELAVGRAQDRVDLFPQETMLGDDAIFGLLEKSESAGKATLGSRQVIGGEKQLIPPTPSHWRKIGLWAGLVFAVGLVGWLVLSLLRDLRREDRNRG